MKQKIGLSIGFILLSTATFALETVPLSEALANATGLASIAPGFLAISNAEGGFICQVGVNESYFKQIANGLEPFPEMAPQSICVSAKNSISMGNQ